MNNGSPLERRRAFAQLARKLDCPALADQALANAAATPRCERNGTDDECARFWRVAFIELRISAKRSPHTLAEVTQ